MAINVSDNDPQTEPPSRLQYEPMPVVDNPESGSDPDANERRPIAVGLGVHDFDEDPSNFETHDTYRDWNGADPSQARMGRRHQPTVAVDLDGTLLGAVDYEQPHLPSGQPALSKPNHGAAGAMDTLRELGWHIIIFTARFSMLESDQVPVAEQEIRDHLQRHQLTFDEICIGPKPLADYYIDDRAMPYTGDWYSTIRKMTLDESE